MYERDPDLAEADALAGGVEALEDIDPLFYEIFTDPKFEVISGDLPWYLPFQFNVVAAATAMTREEFVAEQHAEAEKLRQAVLADADAAAPLQTLAADADAWTDGFLAALEQVGMLREETDAPPVYEYTRVASLIAQLSQGLLFGPAGDEVRSDGDLAGFYAKVREWYGSDEADLAPIARYDVRQPPQGIPYSIPVPALPGETDYDLGLSRPTTFAAFNVYAPWVGAGAVDIDFGSDASDGELVALDLERFREIAATGEGATMTGPLGAGDANWVPDNVALPHQVSYTLNAEAVRPVRELRIVTELDPALNARSFRLGGVTLGALSVQVPAGRAVYQTDIDLSASRGFILRVSAGIDVASSTAIWLLQAIDPETGEVLEGEGANGFLRAGETAIARYTARANDEAADGTTVSAMARVFPDTDAPSDTPAFTYRLDRTAPATDLTVTKIEGTTDYELDWTVSDTGSDAASATIYVASNGGDFLIHQAGYIGDSFLFSGEAGATYEFLVLSRDAAGNRERPPLGISAPSDGAVIDLGGTLVTETTDVTPLPPAAEPSDVPVNELFVEALEGVPATASPTRPAGYIEALVPFSLEALVAGLETGQAEIGALAVAGLADGSVIFSAGPNRGWIYRVESGWRVYGEPVSALPSRSTTSPRMAGSYLGDQRRRGASGTRSRQFRDHRASWRQHHAVNHDFGRWADRSLDRRRHFDVRCRRDLHELCQFAVVDDLAFAPDGSLWATSWPDRGQILRFDAGGAAE